jgi:hypothetical protein
VCVCVQEHAVIVAHHFNHTEIQLRPVSWCPEGA